MRIGYHAPPEAMVLFRRTNILRIFPKSRSGSFQGSDDPYSEKISGPCGVSAYREIIRTKIEHMRRSWRNPRPRLVGFHSGASRTAGCRSDAPPLRIDTREPIDTMIAFDAGKKTPRSRQSDSGACQVFQRLLHSTHRPSTALRVPPHHRYEYGHIYL